MKRIFASMRQRVTNIRSEANIRASTCICFASNRKIVYEFVRIFRSEYESNDANKWCLRIYRNMRIWSEKDSYSLSFALERIKKVANTAHNTDDLVIVQKADALLRGGRRKGPPDMIIWSCILPRAPSVLIPFIEKDGLIGGKLLSRVLFQVWFPNKWVKWINSYIPAGDRKTANLFLQCIFFSCI